MTANRPHDAKPPRQRRQGVLPMALGLLIVGVLGVIAVLSWFGGGDRQSEQGTVALGGPFTLVDQDGRTVTDADFRGKYLLIYFGYAYCPDVCPTSLVRNTEALDLLGPQAEQIVPMLISVDPERDTPERLKDYAGFFHPRLVALTGTPEQVAAVAKAYRVYYAKAELDRGPDAYLIDHSSFTYLMGPDGRFLQFFRHDLGPEEMAKRIKQAL